MAFTKYQIILALVLVVSGTLNTISVKWMDMIEAPGRDRKPRLFVHPFVQADFMFMGEMLCLAAFVVAIKKLAAKKNGSENTNPLTKGSRTFKKLVLLPPAMMDITATSLMYFGLSLTNASSFQMLRGSVIVFVAILSLIILKRRISLREWIGIFLIILALVLVGWADLSQSGGHKKDDAGKKPVTGGATTVASVTTTIKKLADESPEEAAQEDEPQELNDEELVTEFNADIIEGGTPEDSNVILGDVLIVIAQLITACQMVYEEIFIVKLDIPPLQMVGFEGIFGFLVLTFLLIPLNFIPNISALRDVNTNGSLEDPLDAIKKIGNNGLLFVPILGLVLSIAFYNFAGISLTKEINATTRMVLDSIRILVVWLFALAVGWQNFHWLQILGFVFLISGMCIYNNIIVDKISAKLSKGKK